MLWWKRIKPWNNKSPKSLIRPGFSDFFGGESGIRSRANCALGLPRLLNVPRTFNSLPLPFESHPMHYFIEKQNGRHMSSVLLLAEGKGFEPLWACAQTDFESAPLWPLRYPSVFNCKSSNWFRLSAKSQRLSRYVLLRCPKKSSHQRCLILFDRCHSLASLHLPPAALSSFPASISLLTYRLSCGDGILSHQKSVVNLFLYNRVK